MLQRRRRNFGRHAVIIAKSCKQQHMRHVEATGTGRALRLAMIGATLFLLAIAPMGAGSVFPFRIFGIAAAYLLFRRPLGTAPSTMVWLTVDADDAITGPTSAAMDRKSSPVPQPTSGLCRHTAENRK
jgi:hypothetical protein